MLKGKLTALDGLPITPRTGKDSCEVRFNSLPVEGEYKLFYYHNEDCESPGVAIEVNKIKKESKDVYRFINFENRMFELRVCEK